VSAKVYSLDRPYDPIFKFKGSLMSQSRVTPPSVQPRALTALAIGLVSFSSMVHAQVVDKKVSSPWQVSVGLGLISTPEYEGGNKTVSSILPDINASYKTSSFGTFAIGSKTRGLSWTAIDTDDYSFGISLGFDPGRIDTKDGTLFKPGSKRLRGVGEIKSSAEVGAFGHVNAGIPLTLAFTKGSGDGKADAITGSIKGHGGSRIELGAEIPWQISSNVGLSFVPNIVWADKKYNQTYFGVTTAQAARSGFRAYNAGAGLKSVGLTVGMNYKIDSNWSANAAASFNQLKGDAAKSPLVQKKSQNTFTVGVGYAF
jgi:MipA family protein